MFDACNYMSTRLNSSSSSVSVQVSCSLLCNAGCDAVVGGGIQLKFIVHPCRSLNVIAGMPLIVC